MKRYLLLFFATFIIATGCTDDPANSNTSDTSDPNSTDPTEQQVESTCSDGVTENEYPCKNIELVGYLTPGDLLGELLDPQDENSLILNDIWGWMDPQTDKEYALVGLNDAVTFVDISAPSEPVVIGKLEEPESVLRTNNKAKSASLLHEAKSSWRDFKVYQSHLYIVSDGQPHGLQIFDLTRLRNVDNPPKMFSEDNHYTEFENAHNIAINEETGFAYVVGSDTYGGGLHVVNLQNPMDPQFVGFHSDSTVGRASTGYVHDTQCVVYEGPDSDYQGDEICMNSSETHIVIANVTDKQNTKTISKVTYDGNEYAHQGWLTEDHRYFLSDDELDELQSGNNTHSYIWDVQDLDNPELIGVHEADYGSIDHNQYVKGNYVYQSNYTAGLRILSLNNIALGELEEVAYFDTYPDHNNAFHPDAHAAFDGAWSNYPFFESGLVIVGDITNGLFILKPNL